MEPEPKLVEAIGQAFRRWRQPLTSEQADAFAVYLQLLEKWNEKVNLTAIRDREAAILRHFVEPSMAMPLLGGAGPVLLDAGSGPGVPGLPFRILDDQREAILVEANHKKAAFLEEVVDELALEEVRVLNGRIEELIATGELSPPVHVLTARAWSGWADLLGLGARLMVPGGRAVMFVGEETLRALRRHLGTGPEPPDPAGAGEWTPAARAGWTIRRVLPLPHLDRGAVVSLELPAE